MTTHLIHDFKITTKGTQLLSVTFPPHPPTSSFDATTLTKLFTFFTNFTPYFSDSPPFYQQVYQAMLAIPPGQTLTYAQLAAQAGNPAAARATGSACSRNSIPLAVPCHRVVSTSGIGAFSGGPGWKSHLLTLETQLGQ